jgi:hypothetical protein
LMAAHGLTAAKNLSRASLFPLNAIIRAHKEQFGSIGGEPGWLR